MSELTSKKRNSLSDSKFGIPSLRKYPLNDEEHVIKAIQMFHHCPIEYKKELAHNINNAAKRYDISISKESKIYDYLNESEQVEIDMLEDIHLMELNLYLVEAINMNEDEARAAVDGAINCWKKRKQFVKNLKDKNKLVLDIKNEKTAVISMQGRNDYNGILQRAKMTCNTMGKRLASGDYDKIKKVRGKGANRGANNSVGKLAKTVGFMGAATIGGAIAGGALGKHSANKKGNGRIVKGVKTAGGAAAGLAVGSLAANVGVLGHDMKEQQIKRNVNDPEKAIRQHAEKYVSFVSSFQSEILEFNPAQQEEGEGEQNG